MLGHSSNQVDQPKETGTDATDRASKFANELHGFSDSVRMDVDELIRALGRPGKYSLAVYFLLSTNYALVSISHFTMAIYASPIPYQCAASEGVEDGEFRFSNDSGTALDSCSVFENNSNTTQPCTGGWVYDAPPGETNVLMEVGYPRIKILAQDTNYFRSQV